MRGENELVGGDILRILRDRLARRVKSVGVRALEAIDVVYDPLAFLIQKRHRLDAVELPRSGERGDVNRSAVARQHAAQRVAGVKGQHPGVAGVEDNRPVAERAVPNTDGAAGGVGRQAGLRLDTYKVGRAARADKDRILGARKLQRAVAAEGDAAAAALRFRADRGKRAAARKADPKIGTHHRKDEIGRRRVKVRQAQGVACRVIGDALGKDVLSGSLLVGLQDLLLDLAVSGKDKLVGSPREGDRSPDAVHALAADGGGAKRHEPAQKQYAKDQADPFPDFHGFSSESLLPPAVKPGREDVLPRPKRGGTRILFYRGILPSKGCLCNIFCSRRRRIKKD